MSRILFCYDGPIKKDENGDYYGTALNDELFERYEVIAENVCVAIRVKKMKFTENTKRFSKITKEKYEIIECPDMFSSVHKMIFNLRKCKKILEREIQKSDYIVARLPGVISSIAVNIAKKLNKPYLVELVGCPWDALWNHSFKGKILAPIMTYITKKRIKNAPYVLYVTKKFLQERYPTKGKSVNCSNVILDKVESSVIEDRKKQIGKSNNIKIIATTAAVNVKYKGQQYVIKALYKLKNKGKLFQYWLIGGGKNNYLKKLVKKYKLENQVKFLGALPHDKVFEKLKEVDIYIQPSKQEGLPRALIEAMSVGCFCLGSETGGIPELLNEKFIFPKGDVKAIQKKIEEIDEDLILEQMKENLEIVKEYDKQVLKNRRTRFYKEFVNDRRESNA